MRTPKKIAHDKEYYQKTKEKQIADCKKRRLDPEYKKLKSSYGQEYYQDHLEERKEYNASHKEERKIWNKTYGETHAAEIKAKKQKYHEAHPEVQLRRLCKRKGITIEDYYAFPQECHACHTKDPGSWKGRALKSFPIDHNHNLKIGDPGYVRGLLCAPCNLAAGQLKDDPERCKALGEYLLRCSQKSSGL